MLELYLLIKEVGKASGPLVQRQYCLVEKFINLDKSGDTLCKASCKAVKDFGLNVRRNKAEKVVQRQKYDKSYACGRLNCQCAGWMLLERLCIITILYLALGVFWI